MAKLARRSADRKTMFLEWWEEYGSLWSPEAETRAEQDIKIEVGSELGGWSETLARLPMLEEPEKNVLQFGSSEDEELRDMTLKDVGREIGLSAERVRQIEIAALAKMRKAMRRILA